MVRVQAMRIVSQAVHYIEGHLYEKMELNRVALALHYSKYHLHRTFANTVGLTIHGYAKRRKLTEAAKLLVYSKKPILEVALMCGYESQQAFTDTFKALYKTSPAKFRETGSFYPLQLEIHLKEEPITMDFKKENIKFATPADVDGWMELVSLAVDGYPCLDRGSYAANLYRYIADKKALILKDGNLAVGVAGFSPDAGSIDFLAVHPQYRSLGITKLFLDKLEQGLFYGKEIALTTYRAGDKADTGYREEYQSLGFRERELLVEYGYPTQRFVLPPKNKEGTRNGKNTKESISKKL
jgi:AraC-like DNA-binding protein/ribosomal protein S18 acetylase RimI-like enzyme